MERLSDLASFFDAVGRGDGYIVITDTARPAIAHRTSCPSVDAANFKEKVILHQRRSGDYFWVAERRGAANP